MTAPGAGRGGTQVAEIIEMAGAFLIRRVQNALLIDLKPQVRQRYLRQFTNGTVARLARLDRSDAADAALAVRPSPRDGGAAGEVERLVRERDEARDDLVEWTKHVAEVNAHAGRMQDKATAAESRAEAAERRLGEVSAENDKLRALLADGPGPCIYCGLPAADMARCALGFPGCGRADDMTLPDYPDQDDTAQLGAAAREGGAVCRDFRQTGDGTTPSAEDGYGRG